MGHDGGGEPIGVAAAKDYLYGRREELWLVIRSERGYRREEAKAELDFLHQQLTKVQRQKRGTFEVDPELARCGA